MNLIKKISLAAAFCGGLSLAQAQAVKIDQALTDYQPVSGISGKLTSIGSDTLNNLMTFWAEEFKKIYPNVSIEIEGKGSSTAPPALIAGTAQLGPMSRKMKAEEVDQFEKKYGYKPRIVGVAIDALAVYVNKDNPIKSLTLQQVDSIFSATRKRGGQNFTTWGQLGLTGEWANKPISLYGRNSASGTYGFFKEHVLKNQDFASSTATLPGTAAIVNAVLKDPNGIGYGGYGYSKGIHVVGVSATDGGAAITPSEQSVRNGTYPISRFLYIYLRNRPTGELKSYIDWILSEEGQQIVKQVGYFSLR